MSLTERTDVANVSAPDFATGMPTILVSTIIR